MVITVKCKGWVRKQSWLMVLVWHLLGTTEEERKKLRVLGVSVEHLTEYLLNICETYSCYTSLFEVS